MYFRSKRSLWLGIFVWVISSLPLLSMFWEQKYSTLKAIIQVAIYLYICLFWFGTGYSFKKDHLKIRCGPTSKKIPYSEITRIKKPGPDAAMVIALAPKKAIRVRYGENNEEIAISPANLDGFVTELKKYCPRVRISL